LPTRYSGAKYKKKRPKLIAVTWWWNSS